MSAFENRVALVTGANRGVGKAFVESLLERGVKKVYAAARSIDSLKHFTDPRVVPLALDITDQSQIDAVKKQTGDVSLLLNNAGVNAFGSLLTSDLNGIERDMTTNYYGTVNVTRAIYSNILNNGGGNIINIISICGLAGMPGLGGYSASKAALFSATQSIRGELKPQGIHVHSVYPGPIDTDMNKGAEIDMAKPEDVVKTTLDAVENGEEDIFPDAFALNVKKLWQESAKTLEVDFYQYQ